MSFDGMNAFDIMGEFGRRVFSMSNRNACDLELRTVPGLYVFHSKTE
jgi:hypothetical protein